MSIMSSSSSSSKKGVKKTLGYSLGAADSAKFFGIRADYKKEGQGKEAIEHDQFVGRTATGPNFMPGMKYSPTHNSNHTQVITTAQSYPVHSKLCISAEDLLQQGRAHDSEEVLKAPECSICFLEFSDNDLEMIPRNLSCGHTLCTKCLQRLLYMSDPAVSVITCPSGCMIVTHVKDYSVMNVPKNYALMRILREMDRSRKNSRREESDAVTGTSVGDQQVPFPKCPVHDDYLRSYCMEDSVLICSSCELYGSHKGHKTMFFSEAALEEKRKLLTLHPDVLRQKERMEGALQEVEKICKNAQESGGKLEDKVDQFFDTLISLVNEKKQDIKTDIRLRTQLRVKALLEQAKDLRDCSERANTVYHSTEQLLRANDYEVLQEAMLIFDQIEGIFVNPPPTAPRARDDLTCTFTEEVRGDICSSMNRAAVVTPEIIRVDSSVIRVEAFYDGFRISWKDQNFVDNTAISYHLQMAQGDANYINIYRGSATKYTWKTDLEGEILYKFRLQVRTTEGVGIWSEPKVSSRAEPAMHWHKKWRNVKVDLSNNELEASWLGGSSNHWATFAGDKLFEGDTSHYAEIEILNLGKNTKLKDKLVIGVVSCGSKAKANTLEWQNRKTSMGEWETTPSWGFMPISGVLKSHTVLDGETPYGKDLMLQVGDRIGVLVDGSQKKLTFFCNGKDLGVAFENLEGQAYLLVVSIRDKIKIRLRLPPPPYSKRTIKLIQLRANSGLL